MAGLYIHIPFCRSRCIYCDFYSTTREAELPRYVAALCGEIRSRRHELADAPVRTIYIGGGTPSLLAPGQLRCILDEIRADYAVDEGAEVTVEMNPDDVVRTRGCTACPAGHGAALRFPFNRVSLGVQTFDDGLLRRLRRRHDALTAVGAVRDLQRAGVANISIDLIYGLPGQTMELWSRDLDVAFGLGVQHLSAYALSYEPGTLLARQRLRGEVQEAPEELSVAMYELLCRRAREAGFMHYEISNFALPGFLSRHNSGYWTGEAYLGFGPGAHSYDGQRTRRANAADLDAYLRDPEAGGEREVLSDDELYDEAVLCGLRTCRGIDLDAIASRFGDRRRDLLLEAARPHLLRGRLVLSQGRLTLAHDAIMTSDDIMSDLMA